MFTRVPSALLKLIRVSHPDSMDAVAKVLGKHVATVSRSSHTMAQYGLVTLTKHGRTVTPKVTADGVTVDFSWGWLTLHTAKAIIYCSVNNPPATV